MSRFKNFNLGKMLVTMGMFFVNNSKTELDRSGICYQYYLCIFFLYFFLSILIYNLRVHLLYFFIDCMPESGMERCD